MEYIEALPLQASTSVFGMHDNAQIASANADTFNLFEICQSLENASGSGSSGTTEGIRDRLVETVAMDISKQMHRKGEFDIEVIQMLYPVVYEQSMNTVLIQECIRYNKLINEIMISLPELLRALKGLVVMSNELEAVANSIAINQVPESWSNVAYPSMKPCGAWFLDLLERLKFITGEKCFIDFESFFHIFRCFLSFSYNSFCLALKFFMFLLLFFMPLSLPLSHSVSLSLSLHIFLFLTLFLSARYLSLSLSISIHYFSRHSF